MRKGKGGMKRENIEGNEGGRGGIVKGEKGKVRTEWGMKRIERESNVDVKYERIEIEV